MTRYLYQARICRLGRPTTIGGDRGPVAFTFDKHHFWQSRKVADAHDIPVLVSHHPDIRIGNLRSLSPNLEWWVCSFEIDEELDVEFEVGQNVSIGVVWHERYADTPSLGEVSVVRRGRVLGAEITHRMPAPAPSAAPKPSPTRALAAHAGGQEIHTAPGVILRRAGIGQVLRVR